MTLVTPHPSGAEPSLRRRADEGAMVVSHVHTRPLIDTSAGFARPVRTRRRTIDEHPHGPRRLRSRNSLSHAGFWKPMCGWPSNARSENPPMPQRCQLIHEAVRYRVAALQRE
jgi:hypothetical protein